MNVFDLMARLKINGCDVSISEGISEGSIKVTWVFESPDNERFTHRKISRILNIHDYKYLEVIVSGVNNAIIKSLRLDKAKEESKK